MKLHVFSRLAIGILATWPLAFSSVAVSAQTLAEGSAQEKRKPRPVLISLKTGEQLRGDLLKVDAEVVEFAVRNTLQAVNLDEVESISFPDKFGTLSGEISMIARGAAAGTSKPTILYKEKAKYTEEARKNQISGTVILDILFTKDGRISDIRVVQGLPYGLTESAIETARRVRFQPAMENGSAIDTRSNLEFIFDLY